MLVIRFTHVEHAHITAIDEFVNGLVALTVDIDARTLQYHLNGWVLKTGTGIVTTITNLQGTVADIGLLFEEGVGQVLIAAHLLIAFQFERMWGVSTAPAATHLQVYILIEHHVAIAVDEREIHRALPVHVPVAVGILSVARTSVRSFLEHANLRAVKEVGISHDGYYGQVVVLVAQDIGTCGDA